MLSVDRERAPGLALLRSSALGVEPLRLAETSTSLPTRLGTYEARLTAIWLAREIATTSTRSMNSESRICRSHGLSKPKGSLSSGSLLPASPRMSTAITRSVRLISATLRIHSTELERPGWRSSTGLPCSGPLQIT